MSQKNMIEAKALRRANRGEYKGHSSLLRDYWTSIRRLKDGKVVIVPLDKALRLTKGYVTMGQQIFKLNPKWELA
jgi:hypothetical protein